MGEVDLDAAIRAKIAAGMNKSPAAETLALALLAVLDVHQAADTADGGRVCRDCLEELDDEPACLTVRVVARELGVTQ